VVEDLIYIDDLEILIYTTVAPKTSSIFINTVKKASAGSKGSKVEVITLDKLNDDEARDQTAAAAEKQASLGGANYY